MLRSYLFVVITSVLLGLIGMCVKLIGHSVPAMTVNFFRVFIGFLVLLAIVPFLDHSSFRVTRRELKEFFLVGLCYAVSFSTFVGSLYYIPIQNAILILSLAPFFILGIASFFLGEKMTRTKLITMMVAFVGLLIMNPLQNEFHFFGTILAFVSLLFYAFMVVGMRRESMNHGIKDVLWFFFFATLLLLPFPFIYGLGDFYVAVPYLLVLGIFATGFAYLCYNLALKDIEAGTSSIIINVISPLVAIFLAIWIVQEELNTQMIVGGAILILSGVFLEVHDSKLKKALMPKLVKVNDDEKRL